MAFAPAAGFTDNPNGRMRRYTPKMRNFRRIISDINVAPILDQIGNNPEWWNYDQSWTANKPGFAAIYAFDYIIIRFTQGGPGNWDRPALRVFTTVMPVVYRLVRAVRGVDLGKVIVTRLRAGNAVGPHIDHMPPGVPVYWQRFQIPLQADPDVISTCGNERVFMSPGYAWWFDNQQTHSVGKSARDRISILVDIRPSA